MNVNGSTARRGEAASRNCRHDATTCHLKFSRQAAKGWVPCLPLHISLLFYFLSVCFELTRETGQVRGLQHLRFVAAEVRKLPHIKQGYPDKHAKFKRTFLGRGLPFDLGTELEFTRKGG